MKKALLYFFGLIVSLHFTAHSQSKISRLDSLKQLLPKVEGIQKLQVMSDVSEVYMLQNDFDNFALNQIKLKKELDKFPKGAEEVKGVFYCNQGVYFMNFSNYKDAIISLEMVTKIKSNTKRSIGFKVLAYRNLSEIYRGLNQFHEAISYLNDAERFAKKNNVDYHNNIVIILQRADIYNYLKSLAEESNTKDKIEYTKKASSDYNKVYSYLKENEINTTVKGMRMVQLYDVTAKGLYSCGRRKEAQDLFDTASKFLLKNNIYGYYYILKQIEFQSKIKDENGIVDYNQLLKDINATLNYKIPNQDSESYYQIYICKADVLVKLNQYEAAIKSYEAAYIMLKLDEENLFNNGVYQQLGDLYEKLGFYKKSSFYRNQAIKISETLLNESSLDEEKKTRALLEIERTKQAKQLEFEKVKSERNFNYAIMLLLGFILSMVVLFLLFMYNRNLKTKQKLLVSEVNYNKEVALNSELDTIYKIKSDIENQKSLAESEKKVAKNLHDDLASGLAAMNHFIKDKVTFASTEKDKKAFILVNEEVNSMYENVRNYIYNLYNQKEHSLSVNEYLYDLIKKNDFPNSVNYNIDADFEEMDFKLNVFQQNQLYRIIKETIINSLKYSKAKNIAVKIEIDSDECKFSVSDDGMGFKENYMPGIGLKNVEERINALKGKFSIKSEKLKGVQISGSFIL